METNPENYCDGALAENGGREHQRISEIHGKVKRSVRANFSMDMFNVNIDLHTKELIHLIPISEYVGHIGVDAVLGCIPESRLKAFCKEHFGWVEDDE